MSVSSDFTYTVLSIAISALVSGLLGVQISNWYYKRNEVRRLKLRVLQQLMGNRYDFHCIKWVEALNQIPVVFYESKEVLITFKAYHEHIQGNGDAKIGYQRLLELIKAMYKHLNMSTEPLNDNIFLSPFVAGERKDKQQPVD